MLLNLLKNNYSICRILFVVSLLFVSCKKDDNTPFKIDDTFPTNYLPAFPGAEGFGAVSTGGRGGKVVYVTNLNPEGEGSLNHALGYHNAADMQEPRYILFKVSGIVSAGTYLWDHIPHVEHGEFTLAGQTSPGGIVLPGLHTMCKEEPCDYSNIIIRHLRSRPTGLDNSLDDAIRLIGAQNTIIDHCSFGWASDECMQIANNKNFTVQNCIISETLGEHFDRGGVLIKYADAQTPLTNISFHHNNFNRIGGRYPQIDSNDGTGNPYYDNNYMNIELSCNLYWDPISIIYFKDKTLDGTLLNYWFNANVVNNYYFVRPDYTWGMFSFPAHENSTLYLSGNKINIYPEKQDYELEGGRDYIIYPGDGEINGTKKENRHDFAEISYTPTNQLIDYMVQNVGAFPRDLMDTRLMGFVAANTFDATPHSEKGANDGHSFSWSTPPPPYLDSDDDGMPDWWEIHNGLNPKVMDHNGKELSNLYTGVEGYDNLEVFLNRLSDNLVSGRDLTEGSSYTYPLTIANFTATNHNVQAGSSITISFSCNDNIIKAELSLGGIENPFNVPTDDMIDITSSGSNNIYSKTYTIPAKREPGEYQILAHVEDEGGNHGYKVLTINVF